MDKFSETDVIEDSLGFEDLMEEVVQIKEQEFFAQKFYYSYSSLNKLLWNPQAFYQMYVLGIKEERLDAHLVQGKLIHLLLLEPQKFDQEFMVTPSSLPTGSLRIVVDRVFSHYKEVSQNGDMRQELKEFSNAILDVMRDINYYQSLKTDQQRLDKILTPEANSYWEFLKIKGGKTLVDDSTIKYCTNVVGMIKENKQIVDLLGLNVTEFDSKTVYNELKMSLDVPDKNWGLKGVIDNIVVDHEARVVTINDFKTTSKDLKDFPESVEYYGYWLQAAIYSLMVGKMFYEELNRGYSMKFNFIVVDRTYQTYAFPVHEKTLTTWLERFDKSIEVADWHFQQQDYSLPYEFANGLVSL
jgi:hypothetical protein